MADFTKLVGDVEKSVSSSLLMNDPAYKSLYEDVNAIANVVERCVRDLGYSPSAYPYEIEGMVKLQARKEIFMRLATYTAPEFNIEERSTKISKDDRFQHYLDLCKLINADIKRLDNLGVTVQVKTGQMVNRRYDGSLRNYALGSVEKNELRLDVAASDSLSVSWDVFQSNGANFAGYQLLVSTVPIYDAYAVEDVVFPSIVGRAAINIHGLDSSKAMKIYNIADVKRTKARVDKLLPGTHYYLVLVSMASDSNYDVALLEVDTLV